MLHRHGGTLCHRFASLLEDGDPPLQVPRVRFERVQCCNHQCLDDRWRACVACHGGSLCKTFLSRGGNPVRLRDGSVVRGGYLPQGGMDTSGLDLVELPTIGLHTLCSSILSDGDSEQMYPLYKCILSEYAGRDNNNVPRPKARG